MTYTVRFNLTQAGLDCGHDCGHSVHMTKNKLTAETMFEFHSRLDRLRLLQTQVITLLSFGGPRNYEQLLHVVSPRYAPHELTVVLDFLVESGVICVNYKVYRLADEAFNARDPVGV